MCDIFNKGSDPLAAYAEFNTLYNKLFGTKKFTRLVPRRKQSLLTFFNSSFVRVIVGVNCTQTRYHDYINQMKDVRPYPENDNAAGTL